MNSVSSPDEWWNSFIKKWNQVISSYLTGNSITDLDESEQTKLQQRLEQLLVCLEENFHSQFDSRFTNTTKQQELLSSVEQKEAKLRELVEEVKTLRESVIPSIEEKYDDYYTDTRKILIPKEKTDGKEESQNIPDIPSLAILQEQTNSIIKLTEEISSTDVKVQENIKQADNLLASVKQCISQFTDPESESAQIISILRPKRQRETDEHPDAPARKKIASRFRRVQN